MNDIECLWYEKKLYAEIEKHKKKILFIKIKKKLILV